MYRIENVHGCVPWCPLLWMIYGQETNTYSIICLDICPLIRPNLSLCGYTSILVGVAPLFDKYSATIRSLTCCLFISTCACTLQSDYPTTLIGLTQCWLEIDNGPQFISDSQHIRRLQIYLAQNMFQLIDVCSLFIQSHASSISGVHPGWTFWHLLTCKVVIYRLRWTVIMTRLDNELKW